MYSPQSSTSEGKIRNRSEMDILFSMLNDLDADNNENASNENNSTLFAIISEDEEDDILKKQKSTKKKARNLDKMIAKKRKKKKKNKRSRSQPVEIEEFVKDEWDKKSPRVKHSRPS